MNENEWWRGQKLDQATHAAINARYYPGTRELCCKCGEATGRAGREDDSIYLGDLGPLCEQCRDEIGAIGQITDIN